MMRSPRLKSLLLVLGASVAFAACDALLTDPAPPPASVDIAFQITPTGPGTSATAFSRVRRIALRFITPDSAAPRDTIVAVVPTNGEIRARVKLETRERVDGLAIVARLEGPTGPLFDAAAVTQIQPGVPTTVDMNLLPVPAAVVADRAMLSMPGPGSTDSLTSAVLFSSGDTINGLSGAWLSQDPGVVVIAPNGLAGAVAIGTTNLELRFDTLLTIVPAEVTPAPVATVTIAPGSPSISVAGTVPLTAITRDAQNNVLVGRPVTWSTSDPTVATVDATGLVTGVAAGTATITATSEGVDGTTDVTVTPVVASRVSWINPSGGNWSLGSNWSTGSPPAAGDSVEITLSGSYTVDVDVAPPTLTWVSIGGTTGTQVLQVQGGRTVDVTGATLIGGFGELFVIGSSAWNSGVVVGPTGMLRIGDGTIGGSVNNSGTVAIVGNAATGSLTNQAGGNVTFNAPGAASLTAAPGFTNSGMVTLSSQFANDATLIVAGSALRNLTGGIILVDTGGGGTRGINAVIDNRATFAIDQPLTTTTSGGSHANTGTITVDANWTISGAAAFTNTGTLDVNLGDLTVGLSGSGAGFSPGTLPIPGGRRVNVTGGPLNSGAISGSGTLDLLNLNIAGSGLTLPAGTNTRVANVTSAVPITSQGTILVASGSNFDSGLTTGPSSVLQLNSLLTVPGGFTNNGTIEFVSTGPAQPSLNTSNGTLVNGATALIDVQTATAGPFRLDAVLDNQGQFTINHPISTATSGGDFSNSGVITMNQPWDVSGADGFLDTGSFSLANADFQITLSGSGGGYSRPAGVGIPAGRTLNVVNGPYVSSGLTGTGTLDLQNLNISGSGLTLSTTTNRFSNVTASAPIASAGTIVIASASSFDNGFTTTAASVLRLNTLLTVPGGFTNNGTIEFVSTGPAQPSLNTSNGTLVNAATGVIDVQTAAAGAFRLDAVLDNQGQFTINHPISTATTGGNFSNSGTITVNQPWDVSGADGFGAGGTVDLSSGDLTLNLSGTGGGFTTSSAIVVGTGQRLWIDGGPTVPLTLAGGGGRVRISNATVSPGTGMTVSAASILELDNATLNVSLANAGLIEELGGTAFNGPITAVAGSTLRLLALNSSPTTIASGFTNEGTIDMNSGVGGNPVLNVAGTIGNAATGTIRASFGGGGTVRTINANVVTTGTIDLQVPLVLGGDLTDPVGAPSTFTSNGSSLTVDGLNVDGATFNDMPLINTGAGTFSAFNNATFAGMDPTVIQLDFTHPGTALAPISFNGLNFSTTPTTGLFIQATDSDGTGPFLTINVNSSSPSGGAAWVNGLNGASVIWPS